MINYDGKKFRAILNSENGEVSEDLIFEYRQIGDLLSCHYSGTQIRKGFLLGIVSPSGVIEMTYQQVNFQNELRTGKCISTPEVMKNGRICLHEVWEWTNGDLSSGYSLLEEIG